jgi:hypothetical protein
LVSQPAEATPPPIKGQPYTGSIGAATGIVLGVPADEYLNNEYGNGGAAKPLFGFIGLGIALLGTTRSGYYTAYAANSSVQPLPMAESFEDMMQRIGPEDRVSVTETGGREFGGEVQLPSSGSLMIQVEGQRRELTPAQMKAIRLRLPDPLKNGILWGTLIGMGAGVAATAVERAQRTYGSGVYDHPSDYIRGAAMSAVMGAVVGPRSTKSTWTPK